MLLRRIRPQIFLGIVALTVIVLAALFVIYISGEHMEVVIAVTAIATIGTTGIVQLGPKLLDAADGE